MQIFEEKVKEISAKDISDPQKYEAQIQKIYKETEDLPYWKGLYSQVMHVKKKSTMQETNPPLFEKIRQGELWRIATPAFIHADFLHILFNIAWLWVLGRQIESRIGKWKWLLLVLVIACVSNVAQYITTGPFFMGLSGVVVGMAGFIWSRQRKAPWEGYPLQRNTLLFIVFFVIIMFLLEIASFVLNFFSLADLTPNIANTAHVVGGLVGAYLGRLNFFSRGET